MSIEEKLKEYRALRRRKELIEKLEETKEKVVKFLTPKIFANMGKDEEVLLVRKVVHKSRSSYLKTSSTYLTSE